jgi:hypothetical protein
MDSSLALTKTALYMALVHRHASIDFVPSVPSADVGLACPFAHVI